MSDTAMATSFAVTLASHMAASALRRTVSDAQPDLHLFSVQEEWGPHPFLQPIGQDHGSFDAGAIPEQYREFITADAKYLFAVTEHGPKPVADLTQQFIAHFVSEPVVDSF